MSETQDLLDRADETLATAELLVDNDRLADAVSRAYYAMFHAARAALLQEDSRPKTHAGVATELSRLYRDRMDRELIAAFSTIQDLREDADYGLDYDLDRGQAEDIVATAQAFITAVRDEIGQ